MPGLTRQEEAGMPGITAEGPALPVLESSGPSGGGLQGPEVPYGQEVPDGQEVPVIEEGTVESSDAADPAWEAQELAAPLGNSSLETFSNFLNSLKKGFDQGSEIALLVVEFLYKSNNPTAIKILNLYRTDCRFRKALRNATLDAVNNAGLIYSLRRDQKCINNADRAFIAAALASLAVNIATVIRQYIKA